MLRRLLNIASIVCLVACVALMGMWLRSYRAKDEWQASRADTRVFSVSSFSGHLCLSESVPDAVSDHRLREWEYENGSHDWRRKTSCDPLQVRADPPTMKIQRRVATHFGFAGQLSSTDLFLWVPYWFLTLTTGAFTMIFRIRWPWRFSLRGLFITTTFLAVVLGMSAWLDRSWMWK